MRERSRGNGTEGRGREEREGEKMSKWGGHWFIKKKNKDSVFNLSDQRKERSCQRVT